MITLASRIGVRNLGPVDDSEGFDAAHLLSDGRSAGSSGKEPVGEAQLNDRHVGRAVADDQRRRDIARHAFQHGLARQLANCETALST